MIIKYIRYFVGIATILTGLASLFFPLNVQNFTGLQANGGRGITEIRTILGALFVGFGAAVLYFNQPVGYKILGITYVVMGVVRGISIMVDKSAVTSNIISVIVELVFGVLLLI